MDTAIKVISKTQQVKEYLINQISNGDLRPNDCIIPESKLAKMLGVSTMCTRRAFAELCDEGKIYRIQGKGTFVANKEKRANNYAGLLIPVSGHLYQDMAGMLTQGLHDLGFLPTPMDIATERFREHAVENLKKILALNPALLIVAGGLSDIPYKLIKQAENRIGKLIFWGETIQDYEFSADYVLSDYEYGAEIAVKHLVERGHQRILYVNHKSFHPPQIYHKTSHYKSLNRYREILKESGLKGKEYTLFQDSKEEEWAEEIRNVFSEKNHPTAVFALNDFRAAVILREIRKMGLRVPDDVAIVGYCNTPWATSVEVPLTSISIREDSIADAMIELAGNHNPEKQRIVIKPELVIRESS